MVVLSMVTSSCKVNTVVINLILKRNRLLERLKEQSTLSSQEVIWLGHGPRQSGHSHSLEAALLNAKPSCLSSKCLYVALLSKLQLRKTLEEKQRNSSLSLGYVCLSGYISYISLVLCSLVWDILCFFRGYIMTWN